MICIYICRLSAGSSYIYIYTYINIYTCIYTHIYIYILACIVAGRDVAGHVPRDGADRLKVLQEVDEIERGLLRKVVQQLRLPRRVARVSRILAEVGGGRGGPSGKVSRET